MIVNDSLHQHSLKYPEDLFLKDDDREITYGEADIKVSRLASALALYLKQNFPDKIEACVHDRVTFTIALHLQPGVDYVLMILAGFRLRFLFPPPASLSSLPSLSTNPNISKFTGIDLRLLPLNPHKTEKRWDEEMGRAGVDLLIYDEYDGYALAKKNQTERATCSLTTLKALEGSPLSLELSFELSFDSASDIPNIPDIKEGPFIYLFTSGSSGRSKLAVFSWENWMRSADSGDRFFPFRRGDNWLHLLPFYHVSGMSILFRALLHGAAMVFTEKHREGWENVLATHPITHISLVPAQIRLRASRSSPSSQLEKLSSLKMALVGGGPIPESFKDYFYPRSPLRPTYGLTESVAHVAIYDGHPDGFLKVLSPGRVRVRGGEIFIHREKLFLGYWEQGKLIPPWDEEGWFATGDLGEMVGDDLAYLTYLTIKGRKDRQFISGGENIQPEEIEGVILAYPGHPGAGVKIIRTCVFPIDHPRWGRVPAAVLDYSGDILILKRYLPGYLEDHLERYKVPKKFFGLPKSFNQGIKIPYRVIEDSYRDQLLPLLWESP